MKTDMLKKKLFFIQASYKYQFDHHNVHILDPEAMWKKKSCQIMSQIKAWSFQNKSE